VAMLGLLLLPEVRGRDLLSRLRIKQRLVSRDPSTPLCFLDLARRFSSSRLYLVPLPLGGRAASCSAASNSTSAPSQLVSGLTPAFTAPRLDGGLLGRRARLALEAAQVPRIEQGVGGQHLDGHEPAQRQLLGLVDDAHAAAAEDGLDLVAEHGNRSARTLRLRARLLRGRACHIGGREGVVGKSAGSDIGGNVRARWSGARFVVGGTEGIVRFCRRHRSPSFEQPRG